jgi:adenylate cyclase
MFVDIRNFTEISERLAPTAVVGFLNTFLDALSRHVIENEGTLDKFIGDSIMAFWNAPVDVSNHASKAVHAALAMRETLARLNADDAFGFGNGQIVSIGIGIHTGLACVGNMGAETHFNYSAVGDTVNVAARIEAACKEVCFDILVSESTANLAQQYALLEAGALALKGKSTRTRTFSVVGDERLAVSAEFIELKQVHGRMIEALASRSPAAREILRLAKRKSAGLPLGLAEFYRRISRRAEHFPHEPAKKDDVPAK